MIAFDTSFILAAEGWGEAAKQRRAAAVMGRLSASQLLAPAQVLAEVLHVLKTDGASPAEEAAGVVARWLAACRSIGVSENAVAAAAALSAERSLPFEDALVVASAREGGARLLLSEDIADGFSFGGLTVANPFAKTPHPRLHAVLGPGLA